MEGAKVRVSDLISMEEIATWEPGSIITIKAGTGAGKSFFVKNSLYEYAKSTQGKILMLIHRENCAEQFRLELERSGKTDVIDIRTYQFLEHYAIHNGSGVDLKGYTFIVADEFHYFLSDATFNWTTDVSFDQVMAQDHAIRIFMSATAEDMCQYINLDRHYETINYELPVNYDHISNLTFFDKDDTLLELAQSIISSDEKAVFFVQDVDKAYSLYKRFREYGIFNCSRSNKRYYRYVDANLIRDILKTERFDAKILVTTACFDAGVNLIDEDIRHIIIDMSDIDTIVQCAGRKRIQHGQDKFSLYIKNLNNCQLGGLETSTKNKLSMANYLMGHSTEEFLRKYPRCYDNTGIIFDEVKEGCIVKRVNPLMYRKKQNDIAVYRGMKGIGEFGFCKFMAKRFGFYDSETDTYNYTILHEEFALERYLSGMVGKIMLRCSDRKELIERIDVKNNGRHLRSLDVLNSTLRERNIPYRIEQFQTSRIVEGKKKNYNAAWRVCKIDSEEQGAA